MLNKITIPSAIRKAVAKAIADFAMIKENDAILIGLSGGKDSLTLIHVLRSIQQYAPVKFSIAAVTVDYQNPNYQPASLIPYLESLEIKHFYIRENIVQMAKDHMGKNSYTAFSSRMRRGIIYQTARVNGYNVIALAQHADDILSSFFMSLWFEGNLQTMKAHYTINQGDLRVIRPLCYAREQWMKDFSLKHNLPIVPEDVPSEFSAPKERASIKEWLASVEKEDAQKIQKTLRAITPMLRQSFYDHKNC
ncbi:MAG: ATP-binding protein [Methylacidiphilales bacterium]|nr:ATP-binding protein [Candidatus Methylacidiphilales bacterium]